MDPFFRATLVKPPTVTYCFSADNIKGLKSKCLGSRLSPEYVGVVDNDISG